MKTYISAIVTLAFLQKVKSIQELFIKDDEQNGCFPAGFPCTHVSQCCTLGGVTCCYYGYCYGGASACGLVSEGDSDDARSPSAFELYLANWTGREDPDFEVDANGCSPLKSPCSSTSQCCPSDKDVKCEGWETGAGTCTYA